MADETETPTKNVAIMVAIWSAALLTIFVAFRSSDLLKLPQLIGNLGGGQLFELGGMAQSFAGVVIAILIGLSWFGLGSVIAGLIKAEGSSLYLEIASRTAIGAAAWSLLWFVLGLVGGYNTAAAALAVAVGVAVGIVSYLRGGHDLARSDADVETQFIGKIFIGLIGAAVVLALVSALAPPIAKDTLLYHFSVPKAFIAQGSNAFVDGNIASYLALGTEMHVVWAMLLGNVVSSRAAETAAGATTFLFFPLLLAAIYGWARQLEVSKTWALAATLMVASVPTAFHVASSGYIDLALSLYVLLAVAGLASWWRSQATASLALVAIFLGAALAVKLTAVFVAAAFALVILLRARKEPAAASRIALTGLGTLLLAGVIASPWYLRNWAATGSPVFPFYMSIWKGTANGWDVERSNLFQGMNSQYGGADVTKVNYLTSPLRVSLAAQPENPELYDGVLGPAFLIGLPLLILALWNKKIGIEAAIAVGTAGIIYLFWLFSSPQLRYLLPIAPLVAIGIAAAARSSSLTKGTLTAWLYSLVAASVVALLTSAGWFCQKAPLRVALGGETRDQYLARNLDYYPYYQEINSNTSSDAKVWLINMRRDTYNIDRPVVSDYLFEDWTLRKMVWESRDAAELKAKTAAMGIKYVLARHDFLLDPERSTLIDDKRPRAENEAKLRIAKELILDPARTVRADAKFSLIRTFTEQ